MTRDADFKAIVRARARQRGQSYVQARRETLGRRAGPRSTTLHVTNGDSAAATIGQAGVDGPILAWRDVLHEGPVPAGLAPAELREARASYLAGAGYASLPDLRRDFEACDALLDRPFERYVLWFEADLYDQLQLVQVLDRLAAAGVPPASVELVSVGEFPGVAHFGGLGELTAPALAGLFEQRVAMTSAGLDLAVAAWAAFRSPDPSGLVELADARSGQLRFLGEALARLAQEYPWRGDGLPRPPRRILDAVADRPATAADVFRRVWARERRPYLADAPCFAQIRALAAGPCPLLLLDGDEQPFASRTVALTEAGRQVLDGQADHVALNGLDRWIGGVHLTAPTPWRYDQRRERIVPA